MSKRKRTIFIIVTHLVGLGSRRVDGLLSDANFLTGRLLETWSWVNSGSTDTNFFVVGGGLLLEAWRVNSGARNTGLLAIGWVGSGRVYGLIESDLFTIAGLELGSVLTFGEVKLSLVVLTTVVRKLDGDVSVVVSALVWKLDVDVGFGVFRFGSDRREEENVSRVQGNRRWRLLCQQTRKIRSNRRPVGPGQGSKW